jgi:hypothetical protein
MVKLFELSYNNQFGIYRKPPLVLGHSDKFLSQKQTNKSMVCVRERTIPTERPPLVGEVIANFCG